MMWAKLDDQDHYMGNYHFLETRLHGISINEGGELSRFIANYIWLRGLDQNNNTWG